MAQNFQRLNFTEAVRSAAEKRNNDCREIIQETWPVCHPDLDIVTESRPCRPSLFGAVEQIEMNKLFSKSVCLMKPRLDLLQLATSILYPKNMSVQFKTLNYHLALYQETRLSLEIAVPLRFDHCFWFGDLNYRLDLSSEELPTLALGKRDVTVASKARGGVIEWHNYEKERHDTT